ncbi:MAG: hypothetical protein Q4G02_03135 [bacterium]|nr:hypothetical protein [bacterium]
MWKKFLAQPWLVFLAIFLLSLCLRLSNLDLPVAITHDELDYALNSKWLSLTGSDLTQTWQWWSLQPIETQTLTAELTSVVEALFIPLVSFNLIGVRLLSVLLGALLPAALMLWLNQLQLDKKIVYIAGLLFAFNPWGLVQSHLFYEAPLALFFLLLALVFLVALWQNKKNVLWQKIVLFLATLLFFVLSFYSYHGYKFLVLPVFLIQAVWLWCQNQPQKFKFNIQAKIATLAIFATFSILYIATYLQQDRFSDRSGEVIFTNATYLQETAAQQRLLSLETPFNRLFSNKLTVLFNTLANNFLQAFDLSYWFVNADSGTLFGLIDHGWFYLLDLPLIILGLVALLTQKKWQTQKWLWFGLLIVATVPAVVYSHSFTGTFRMSFFIPIALVLAAFGWSYLIDLPWKKWRSPLLITALIAYALAIGYWQWFYIARYPINSIGTSLFNERLMVNYLRLWQKDYPDQKLLVVVDNPYAYLRAFIFYVEGETLDEQLIANLAEQLNQDSWDTFVWHNFTFTSSRDLSDKAVKDGEALIFDSLFESVYDLHIPDQVREIIASPIDSGAWFTLISQNDQTYLCADQTLPAYVHLQNKKDFALETLSRENFCQRWLMQNDYGKVDLTE